MYALLMHKPAIKDKSSDKKAQKAHRKDIERKFGVLQARLHVLRKQSYLCQKKNNSTCQRGVRDATQHYD